MCKCLDSFQELNLIETAATERVAALQKKLELARSVLQDTLARFESEKARIIVEMQESQQFFQGLCAKTEKELEETEKELNAEVRLRGFHSYICPD
jgi:hypothetical protein